MLEGCRLYSEMLQLSISCAQLPGADESAGTPRAEKLHIGFLPPVHCFAENHQRDVCNLKATRVGICVFVFGLFLGLEIVGGFSRTRLNVDEIIAAE